MMIGLNKVVSLAYELRANAKDGNIVETTDQKHPFVFLFGKGNVLEDFESNLKEKSVGDQFQFMIESEKGYGAFNPEAIVNIPKNIFFVDGILSEDLLEIGSFINMEDSNDNPMQGKVLEVGDHYVKMDFNHPMAGQNLFFSGYVVGVREATHEELAHGHIHGEGGVHH
jgi:FKBP-type peptidyl-prolyl cis-trans isomerase SlyD